MYRSLVKPLLFSLPPETAHHLGIGALKVLGAPGVRGMAGSCTKVDDPVLETTVAGIDFPSPVGLAAGFDKNAEALAGIEALGFGFLEAGTLTPRAQPGNDGPRLFRFPSAEALVNRLGFNNAGAAAVAERFSKDAPRLGIPLGVNIGKNKTTPNEKAADDYLACLELLFPWADFFVVNVSSPNTPGLRSLQAPSELEPLLAALSKKAEDMAAKSGRPRPPLFVKVSPDEDFGEAAVEIALKTGFSGIVATNTTRSREGLPAGAPSEGGMSGRPLFGKSTDALRRLFKAGKGKVALIGVGGVFSAEDAYGKISAGASLVEVYTGLIYRGPGLAREINRGLAALLKRDGFRSVSDAVGRSA